MRRRLLELTKRNPQASKVYLDKFGPKEDITGQITADDFIEAGKRLIEHFRERMPTECSGKCPLLDVLPPLHDEARVDSGQGHGEAG